jgi:ectoine hydroxylase-related dioxygenase (phytanoyl-CoA dioxygenase family)
MRRVLNNDELEKQFQKDGYVSVPFISEIEVAELKQMFFDTLPESGGQITAADIGAEGEHLITYDFTFIDKNPEYKRKVFKIITEYFEPHMNRLLADYRPIIANYIRKKSEAGEVPLHQNWAFADERKCTTVSIWCPLVDSTVENGTLQVVPGSHKRFGEVRGPMVPWELDGIKKEIIENHLIPLETKAGDCVILDDSIVHYSAVNKTEGLRLAIQLICIPKEFPSYHYHLNYANGDGKVEVLEVDQEFYIQFNPWKFPTDVKTVEKVDFSFKPLSENDFIEKLKQPRYDEALPKSEASLWSKIKNFWLVKQ